ncbi:acetyl-CoA carboxylase biotin carboxyl carrier protein subunit [Algibacter mikhailovii]|uniref:Lipoyl-binding domain-containing protein n=1 Tax=Algibacter mikhailovii TaxID=425498 RepID=A0A918VAH6_9FLAO|nr:acetyl-CoA carboxylase biotin carboxyl carrier protein subunit [Algibacter mikhailovii]GGZ86585.1 hypothetical protein GCM10007028_25850 [Algibacter mikhailovii]
MNFKVQVNSNLEYPITSKDLSELDAINTSEKHYHVLHNNQSFQAEISSSDFINKQYTVKINNNTYNVNISNALDMLISQMGFEVGTQKEINAIHAPMPGLILEINIEVGQEVKENEALFILEAMKMENIITSPRDGIIKSIKAKHGEAVEKKQLLIEFE